MTSAYRSSGAGRSARASLGLLIGLPLVCWQVAVEPTGAPPVPDGVGTRMQGAASRPGGPLVRVGVAVAREKVTLSSPGGLRLEDALTGQPAGELAPADLLIASADGAVLRFAGDLSGAVPRVPSVHAYPVRADDPVYVEGRPYRGSAEVRLAGDGRVTAINELPLEDYLLGVVPLEIGPREIRELAAVEAQAVAARTYAVAHLGGHSESGFDLFGGVEDQVYGGLAAERHESTLGVRRTAGQILVFEGHPIRAYYHSTCGGHTAAIEEVLDRDPAPYLQSVPDQRPDGSDYCAESPRYQWSVVWSRSEFDRVSREGLAAHFGTPASDFGTVESLDILGRTVSGRVRDVAFRGAGLEFVLSRLDIRRVLAHEGRILNSTDFSLVDRPDGLVEVRGHGYGHGAGMCQWGAIGRARAGQSFEQILATYYPGAVLVNVYGGGDG